VLQKQTKAEIIYETSKFLSFIYIQLYLSTLTAKTKK